MVQPFAKAGQTPVAVMAPAAKEPETEVRQCAACGGEFGIRLSTCPRDGGPLEVAAPDPLRGAVLAETYRIVRRVAVGGMGRVYEAEHVRLPQRFAIKVIHEAQAHRTEAVQRFEREAYETSQLRSRHIVEVVDLIRTADGRPSMVAEYLDGEDLQARLDRSGRLEPDRAVAIAIEICRGLSVAHANQVIHRDLKPSNVFLAKVSGGTEVVKLVDFGVAKVEDERNLTQTGAFVGTPAYMAPEQAQGKGDLDHRADVYAAGAVLYHMLSGEPPYGREDATVTLMKLLKGEPPRIRSVDAGVPPVLEAILERAMARDPVMRHGTANALCDELVAFARTRGGAERSVTGLAAEKMAVRSARWLRPRTLLLVLVAALVSATWALAFVGAVLFSVKPADSIEELERLLLVGVPALVGLSMIALGGVQLRARWRSSPRVTRLKNALARALVAGLSVTAVLHLAFLALYTLTVPALLTYREHAVVLGAAALVSFAVYTLSDR